MKRKMAGTTLAALLLAAAPPANALEMAVFEAGGGTRRVDLELAAAPAAPAAAPRMTVFAQGGAEAHRSVAVPLTAVDRAFQSPTAEPERPAPAGRGRHTLAVELRRDDLDWRIAPRDGDPNILSELSWRAVDSVGLRWDGEFPLAAGWGLEAGLALAGSVAGSVRDSDYDFDDRQGEFSRSRGESDGSTFFDLHLGGLYRLGAIEARRPSLALRAGLALHNQSLRFGRAEQQISQPSVNYPDIELPPVGTTFDTRSSYKARWIGPYVGLGLEVPLGPRMDFSADYRFERLRMKGRGNWALREEFAHPDSFVHTAWGRVHALDVALGYRLDSGARLELGAHHVDGETDRGTSDFRWAADGGVGLGTAIDLVDLRWRASAVRLGYTLPF